MADTSFSLMYAAQTAGAGSGLSAGGSATDSLVKPLSELKEALLTASLDIRSLVREQIKLGAVVLGLNTALASFKVPVVTAAPAAGGESKSKLKAEIEQRSPPAYLQSDMALETAMAQLRQVQGLSGDLGTLSKANLKLATDKRVSGSGATVVDLVQVEVAAGRSGIGAGLKGADKEQVLLDFALDAAVNASAFGISLKSAGEMLSAWQVSMRLDQTQGQLLADATQHLGNSGLNTTAADIGSVVQQSGESAVAAGILPEQLAALSAALLNADVDKAGAGASVKSISAALAKGPQGSAAEQSAWKALGLDPGKLTENVPDNLVKALAALKQQPAEQQAALIKTLFSGDDGVRKLLAKPEDLQKAFSLVAPAKLEGTSSLVSSQATQSSLASPFKGEGGVLQWMGKPGEAQTPLSLLKPNDPLTPAYSGAIERSAEPAGKDPQRSWNAFDASLNRLITALAPDATGSLDSLTNMTNGVADMAEAHPKTSTALALAGVGLSAIVVAVMAKAFGNFTDKLLKGVASKLPFGLGGLIADIEDPKAKKTSAGNGAGHDCCCKPLGGGTGGRLKPRRSSIKPRVRREQTGQGAKSPRTVTPRPPRISAPPAPPVLPRMSGSYWPGTMTAFADSSAVSSAPAAPLSGSYARAGRLLARRAPPLRLLSAGYEMVNGVMSGDKRAVVSSGASLAGSSVGAAVGAALGTLILPGVGTMVGGWLGSMAGGAIGESLGDKLGTQVDRLGSPAQVSKDLIATSATSTNPAALASTAASQPVTFNSTIHINGQDQGSAQALANLVVQTTMSQLGQIMPTNPLATRRDAALTDGVAT
ncbi:phage tail tape measure protein [Pseudomonas sp. MYb2]|uniref:phage tail tape measure protein n=1 Tax=unclassified Pseudomonas TaxID=196821 RepID=UPI000CFF8941|nr:MULTISPECIES: phage tail tape measure protein [unclassified Pseudomonas]PRB55347.1 phage tail tape measure protein [Pseudomonas sp. MYb3]PRC33256.1 phage tail tape measure protein [Pseudomonas sp. MYb2]